MSMCMCAHEYYTCVSVTMCKSACVYIHYSNMCTMCIMCNVCIYMCMCNYVYVCMCVYTCVCVYVCIYMCMCVYVYVCMCVCVCICMYKCILFNYYVNYVNYDHTGQHWSALVRTNDALATSNHLSDNNIGY